LHQIADALDGTKSAEAVDYILEANRIVESEVVSHEREDEQTIYPRVSDFLNDGHALNAMSSAHREILRQARLLARLSKELREAEAEPYLIRDAQRIIESIESLVRIHNVQEEDIYEHAATQPGRGAGAASSGQPGPPPAGRGATAFERALIGVPKGRRRSAIAASMLALFAAAGGAAYWAGVHHASPPAHPPLAAISAETVVHAAAAIPAEAKVPGVIEAVYCEPGALVKAGELCAKIDPRPYQLIVEQSKAALATAMRRLEKSKA
jgi:hypothetical protein